MFREMYEVYTELSREYGTLGLRYKQADEGKISAEQLAKEYVERVTKINELTRRAISLMEQRRK